MIEKEVRIEKLNKIREKGIEPYPYKYDTSATAKEIHKRYDDLAPEEERKEDNYALYGRVLMIRNFGRLMFAKIRDPTGDIQLVLKKGETDEEVFRFFKEYIDVGDIIGFKGYVFKTKKGETSIMAKEVIILAKALLPLPEKWHGLKDVDERYRKRYVDLIVNPESKLIFEKRGKILKSIRNFMDKYGFLEVEVPLMQEVYGGAFAKPFKTYSYAWKRDMFLSISPELYLKRLLVGGFEKVYTITRAFRNEDVDRTHNPEFTTMESYAANWDYNDVMDFVEELITTVAKEVNGTLEIKYGDRTISLERPWKRISMKDALKEQGVDVDKMNDEELLEFAKQKGIEVDKFNRGLIIEELFEELVEDKLINPTFIIDHPKESTPLCKKHRKDEELVERFELYINGWELANAYSELNDPILQRKLFEEQVELRKEKGEYQPMDEDYVEALEYGMPPAGGLGIGVDRLVMLLTGAQSIRDVILFPQMKPKSRKNDEENREEDKDIYNKSKE